MVRAKNRSPAGAAAVNRPLTCRAAAGPVMITCWPLVTGWPSTASPATATTGDGEAEGAGLLAGGGGLRVTVMVARVCQVRAGTGRKVPGRPS